MKKIKQNGPLRVAMIGTRGVPAQYGGFETAIEEIGQRMVRDGAEVTVYCRNGEAERRKTHLGMKLVHLPALRMKIAETLSHTALSALHLVFSRKYDAVFVFNAANAPFIPLLRLKGTPVAVHVDGLEWKRSKWGGRGRSYYRRVEELAVRWADALIADAEGIADYYRSEFGVRTNLLKYGAPVLENQPTDKLRELGLAPDGFHLVVARFEPENHVDLIVDGYLGSDSALPLVVVGSAPYAHEYCEKIRSVTDGDHRVMLLGSVWDQELLNQLYAHARSYIHGHSVGGTNPSLLRAMGARTAVIAYDVGFNREVLGSSAGRYFRSRVDLAEQLEKLDFAPLLAAGLGNQLQRRAQENYRWDDVTRGYTELADALIGGYSTRNPAARRNPVKTPAAETAPAAGTSDPGSRGLDERILSKVRRPRHAARGPRVGKA
jgi:glycosyltransferase involved in cell wall biosynthesis